MSYPPAYEEDDAHLTLQPWPGQPKHGSGRRRGRGNPRRRRRILAAGVAVLAAA